MSADPLIHSCTMAKKPGKGKKKIRTEFRKNRAVRSRDKDLTRQYQQTDWDEDAQKTSERISGKGELARKRTVLGAAREDDAGLSVELAVDHAACLQGRVLISHGLHSTVEASDGRLYRCATRRLLKTISTEQRHVVAAGDLVLFRPAGVDEGIIERVEARHGVIARTSRGRQHVLVANVDQVLIITSTAEPVIKPHLIDRLIVTAERAKIRPIVCINKIDLIDPATLQPLAGVYGQMGYEVLQLSATTGRGIGRLREVVKNKQSVVTGQSGVGKSSLLNAIQTGLDLEVRTVSTDTEKGRHTTTTASLISLEMGGWIVDTPGIRKFELWDVIPEEVAGYCRDIRPYVSYCRFPNCTHTHESHCAVKDAVADGRLDLRRYESYCKMFAGDR
jgi:ribosome biogenesis GTPase